MPKGMAAFASCVLSPPHPYTVLVYNPKITNRHCPHRHWQQFFKSFKIFSGYKKHPTTKESKNDFCINPQSPEVSRYPSILRGVIQQSISFPGTRYCLHLFSVVTPKPQTRYFIKEMLVSCDSEGWGIQTRTTGMCGTFVLCHNMVEQVT